MVHFHISGRVLLARNFVNWHYRAGWRDHTRQKSVRFEFNIVNSIIDVCAKLETLEDHDYIGRIVQAAKDYIDIYLDLIAFRTGHALSAVLEHVHDPATGGMVRLFTILEDVRPFCTAFQNENVVLNDVAEDRQWRVALHDLTECLRNGGLTAVNCYRAIEAIRNMIAPGERERSQWPKMHEALRVDEPFLRFIGDRSQNRRHGRWAHVQSWELNEMTKRSWQVMDRFFEYRKRGNTPLPLDEFPLLCG